MRVLALDPGTYTEVAVSFTVYGIAKSQGSMTSFRHPHTGKIITQHAKGVAEWRRLIADAAQVRLAGRPLIEGPIAIHATFHLPRPKSRPRRDRYPDRRPDLDKCLRAVGDALEGVVYRQDSQVCRWVASKVYGDPPRAEIVVSRMTTGGA